MESPRAMAAAVDSAWEDDEEDEEEEEEEIEEVVSAGQRPAASTVSAESGMRAVGGGEARRQLACSQKHEKPRRASSRSDLPILGRAGFHQKLGRVFTENPGASLVSCPLY